MNFSQFLAATCILRVNCNKMPEDRLKQPAYKVSDFSSPSADRLGSRRPTHIVK